MNTHHTPISVPPSISSLSKITLNARGLVDLGPSEIHLWTLETPVIAPGVTSETTLGAESNEDAQEREERTLFESWMTKEERARGERFIFERDQRQHRLTRALCRWVLSRYVPAEPPVDPSAWRFSVGERGKPFISEPRGALPLAFNLTHTDGLVALTVSRDFPTHGVDVERVGRRARFTSLAERHFAPSEIAALSREPEETVPERFFAYWTLKESYIKADGAGLAIPLDQFAFELDRGPEIGLWLAPERADEPRAWWFGRYRVGEDHRVAVGARVGVGHAVSLSARALSDTSLLRMNTRG